MPSPSVADSRQREVWTQYRENLPRHLIGIARHLQSQLMHSLTEDLGHRGLRLRFGPFLSWVGPRGCRLTTIRGGLGISKQACNQIANQIERAGFIERRPTPEDGRGRIAVLTRQGRRLVEQAERLLASVEDAYRESIGKKTYRAFAAALDALRAGLELPVPTANADSQMAPTHAARGLPLVAEEIQRRLRDRMIAKGHSGLKMSHGQVLPLIGLEGGRIGEIARVQEVSKQAISAIARDLEGQGYLQRSRDPVDGRGVLLTLTEAGEALIADSVDAVGELEDEFEAILGRSALDRLREPAQRLYQTLRLEEEIFGAHHARDLAGARIDLERLAQQLRTKLGGAGAGRLAGLLQMSAATGSRSQ